jgi:succinyl-diaminopimelate desuccinylase
MVSEKEILEYVESKRDSLIDFLKAMIQSKSYNPPGDEHNVALTIKQFLDLSSIPNEIYPFGNNRANLVARLTTKTQGKSLLFNGHMDVVPPGDESDWKVSPLSAEIKRKKLMYGRGTTDMKGGLSAMICALKVLKDLNFDTECSGNLILAAVADEETGGEFGTKKVMDEIFKGQKMDFAVVGEPTGLDPLPKAIVVGEKGQLQLKIIVHGASAHASSPFLGKNAILAMSTIIQNLDRLETLLPKISPPIPEEKLKEMISEGFPSRSAFESIFNQQEILKSLIKALLNFTKSVTMIKGGIKENVVPDRCEMVIDFRLLPGQTIDLVIEKMKELVSSLGYKIRSRPDERIEGISVDFEIFQKAEPSYFEGWQSSAETQMFQSTAGEIYGKKPFFFMFPACTDAYYIRNYGLCPNTIVFGPGSSTTSHAANEFIDLEDYINAIKTYAIFAYRLLK